MSLYSKPAGEVLTELGTDAQGGLSSGQVAELAAKYGPNKLREKPKKNHVPALSWTSSRTR